MTDKPVDDDDIKDIGLLDLAEQIVDDIKEVRMERFPKALYDWEVTATTEEEGASTDDESGDEVKVFICKVKLKVLECRKFYAASDIPLESLAGKEFTHNIAKKIKTKADIVMYVGMVKAFMVDIGVVGKGMHAELLKSAIGKRFTAPIKQTADRNDKEKIYSNLNTEKIKPLAA